MPQGKKVTVVKTYSQLIHTNLTNAESDDVFLTKYDSRGNLVLGETSGRGNDRYLRAQRVEVDPKN